MTRYAIVPFDFTPEYREHVEDALNSCSPGNLKAGAFGVVETHSAIITARPDPDEALVKRLAVRLAGMLLTAKVRTLDPNPNELARAAIAEINGGGDG